jgi:predicted Zn-dependent protease
MSVDLTSQAEHAVALAKAAGADEAAATAQQSRDVTFEYRDGALEKVKDTMSQGVSIDVFAAGRYSSHQTTDLNSDRLKSFVAEAVAITRALEPDAFRQITPAELFRDRPDVESG